MPKAERASVVEASSFSSLGPLHAKIHVVFAGACPCVDGPRLVGEALGVRHHLILGTLRHANCEFAARIGAVLPAKSLFARAADAKLHAGEGESLVGEHASADQKVIGVAVFLLATVCGRGGLRLGGRSSFLNWRGGGRERKQQPPGPPGHAATGG